MALFSLLALGPMAAHADEASAIQAVRATPRVLDALVDNGGNLYVSVKNDRVEWGQFAAYLCKVVRPHQARIFKVRVIEVTEVAFGRAPATWPTLAQARCSR